ncbi:MAG: hypothetical protein ACRD2D_06210 [Terriglobales bacterium]
MPQSDPRLSNALLDLAAIRGQMARTGEFRGYGPLALAATAVVALGAAALQPRVVALPLRTPNLYAQWWSAVALLAAALIAAEAVVRARRLHAGLADAMLRSAAAQFLPAAVAGLLLTPVLLRARPEAAALLPGLWQILFSLGVFATCRMLPRALLLVAVWYLATGLLTLASADAGLAPWMMGVPFAAGQSLAAVLLWKDKHEPRQV